MHVHILLQNHEDVNKPALLAPTGDTDKSSIVISHGEDSINTNPYLDKTGTSSMVITLDCYVIHELFTVFSLT